MTSEDWTEKYRPRSLSEVLGSDTNVAAMTAWAREWQSGRIPEKRALVMTGPPGVGKTSAAEALARDFGWSIIEFNASENRNADSLRRSAVMASRYSQFSEDGSFLDAQRGDMNLIVLDEADSLNGTHDRGAGPVISDLVLTTSQPVMILANDAYVLGKKLSVIKDHAVNIRFQRTRSATIVRILKRICREEGISIEDGAAAAIAEKAAGDIRASIKDLQALAAGRDTVTAADTAVLTGREGRSDIYEVLSAVYRRRDPEEARKRYAAADTDPGNLLIWLSDNLGTECTDRGDLIRASQCLSKADIYLAMVGRRMNYGFWSYALDMMLDSLPRQLRSRPAGGQFRFPTYLSRMSRQKSVRAVRNSACGKVGMLMHTSAYRVNTDVLPQLRIMMTEDAGFRARMVAEARLEPEELAFLLGVEPDRKIVKDCYAKPKAAGPKAEKPRAEKPEPAPAGPAASVPQAPKGQRSFSDFL